jgi:hypothetical protein
MSKDPLLGIWKVNGEYYLSAKGTSVLTGEHRYGLVNIKTNELLVHNSNHFWDNFNQLKSDSKISIKKICGDIESVLDKKAQNKFKTKLSDNDLYNAIFVKYPAVIGARKCVNNPANLEIHFNNISDLIQFQAEHPNPIRVLPNDRSIIYPVSYIEENL